MMNRKRPEPVNVRISDEEYSRLENKYDILRNEFLACKRKLDSKCEALLILSKELDQCRSERDQFKLMAEQLRERYQSIKKQVSGQPVSNNSREYRRYSDMQSQSLAKLLFDAKEANKSLQFEHDDLKQKLHDAQGDIKLLREQIARQRVGTTDEGMTTRHFPAHERQELVQKLESSKDQFLQLERDLQTVLDEKEELVTERDVYKTKYERLNQELNYILKGDENRVVDIDALVMENKYLQDRMKQMEEEKSMALAAVSKYKSLLEKKKTKSSLKFGQTRGGGMIITQKQVQQVLDSKCTQIPSPQAMSDLQALAGALLDTVNDKNLALSHQRKTNKILGNRVAELEKKIKTLEVAGLWNVPSNVSASLEKLRQDCDDVKTLIPQMSVTSESDKLSDCDKDSELETVTPLDSVDVTPECSPTNTARQPGHLQLEDLDLLPTKEISSKPVHQDHAHLTGSVFEIMATNTATHFLFQGDATRNNIEDLLASSHDCAKDLLAPSHDCAEDLLAPNHDCADPAEEPCKNTARLNTATVETVVINGDDAETAVVNGDGESGDVHIYADDKSGDSEVTDSDPGAGMDDFICDNLDDDTAEFYGKEDGNIRRHSGGGDGDHCGTEDELKDNEDSDRMGLLMESMAKKMCNISHKAGKQETDWSAGDAPSLKEEEPQGSPTDCSTPSSPLLKGQGEEEAVTPPADEPHDIEC